VLAVHTLSWVGCGGEDGAPPPPGGGDGDGTRDGGLDAGDGGGDAADAAPDADGDFGFEELGLPDAATDSGADSHVPDPPDEFACGQERWGDGAHCDCGCLVQDPDCVGGEGCTEASCEAAGCDVRHDASGAAIRPDSYTCDEATFDALDGCDCGCGAIDPDCIGDGCTEPGCKEDACARCRDDEGEALVCIFTCDEALLGDGTCDCGCGAADPDCSDLGCPEPGCFEDMCERCYGSEGELECARGNCPSDFKTNEVCDCGCRERDPDCITSGEVCLEPSCSAPGCAQCWDTEGTQLICEGWACTEEPGTGDGCNCGCGTADPDCAPGDGCSEPGCQADGCTTCRTASGAPMSCMP
jgi:hypothetical protein